MSRKPLSIARKNARDTLSTAIAAALIGSLGAPAALAQQAPQRADRGAVLENIVVTARKLEENLQDVPIAITALSSDRLTEWQITDLSQITGRVPSLTFQSQNSLESEIFIRGVGSVRLNGATADASVGTFLDEIYLGRRGSATPPIFDLERVEVLRGPQGTLFGKNVVGGAISLITAKPQFEKGGSFNASYGNYNTLLTGGHVTGQLGENSAGRLAFYQNSRDGYARNIVRGEDMEDLEAYALRGSWLWNINERVTLNVSADASKDSSGGPSRRSVDNPTVPGFGPVTPNLATNNPRHNQSPFNQYAKKETYGITARLDVDLSFGDLVYLSSVRRGEGDVRWTQAGTGSPPSLTSSTLTQSEENTGITQEIRISSPQDQRFRWIGGLYYLDDDTRRTSRNTADSFLPGGPGSLRDILDGDNMYIQRGVSRNYAAFGELAYDITDDFKITVGARYTVDKKDWDVDAVEFSFGPPGSILSTAPLLGPFSVSTNDTWRELTPKATAEWRFQEGKLAYGSISKGFKGGGWQAGAANEIAASTPYDPETAWTYEIGLKADFFDNRVRMNLAAFYTDFEDLQVELLDDVNLVLVVANASDAKIKGIEGEFQVRAHEYVTLFASGSILDAKYKDYIDPLRGSDFSDNRMQRTPRYQYNLGADFSMPMRNNLDLTANVEYMYQDDMFFQPDNTNFVPGYGLLDARIGVAAADGSWSLQAFGRNLNDELYRISSIPFIGDEFSLFGPPRTYGVMFRRNF